MANKCECGECRDCKRRAYAREYYRRPGPNAKQREKKAAFYRENAEAIRERSKRYRERNPEKVRAYDRARSVRAYDEAKRKARQAITHAVERGRLTRQPCEVCSRPNAEAHHEDYSKPFDVRWLCRAHHMELHRRVA